MTTRTPPPRHRLDDTRSGITHKFRIGDQKGYITVNCFADGQPGEIFVKMDKQGSQVSGWADSWAICVSLMLQTGIPLETIVNKFRGVSFDPDGWVDGMFMRSPIDYICRWLEQKFLTETPEETDGDS